MIEGGLDGGFWAIYTPQGPRTPRGDRDARDFALLRAVQIRDMVAGNAKYFELALRADDAARIALQHKRVVFMSMENAYPVEADLSLLETFYKLGVRLTGLVHFTNNDLADSATDPKGPEWHGLSEKGRALVAEANRLGIVLDASHASDDVLDQLIATSKTPILLSHSGVKAVFDHPRNIDDRRLRALAASGGVIQINFMSEYLIATPKVAEREAALSELWKTARKPGLTLAERESLIARKHELDDRFPVPRAQLRGGHCAPLACRRDCRHRPRRHRRRFRRRRRRGRLRRRARLPEAHRSPAGRRLQPRRSPEDLERERAARAARSGSASALDGCASVARGHQALSGSAALLYPTKSLV